MIKPAHLACCASALAALALLQPAAAAPASPPPAAADANAERGDALAQMLREEAADLDGVLKVTAPSEELARKAAISHHHDMLDVDMDQRVLYLKLTPEERARIEKLGFTAEPASAWIAQRRGTLERMLAAGTTNLLGRAAQGPEVAGIPKFPCYDTVEETIARMQAWQAKYPNLVDVVDIGDSWRKTQGSGGYDIHVLKLTNKKRPPAAGQKKPVFLLNTGIHAREYAPISVGRDFATKLLEGFGKDADATWILNEHEVHIVMVMNPDGRKHAEGGAMWRKNDNQNFCDSARMKGVDLNRNFAYTWNTVKGGSSGSACDEDFRGPSAGSEPETQALTNYVRSLWPDQRDDGYTSPAPKTVTGFHIDMHSAASLVLWPWGETRTKSGNDAEFQALGKRLAFFNKYVPQVSIGLYPTDGTSDGPAWGELGVPSYTIELDKTFFESCKDYEAKTGPDNVAALMYAAKIVGAPYVTPSGPDVTTVALDQNAATTGVKAGTKVQLTGSSTDTRFSTRGGAQATQNITAAEAYIDLAPWRPGAKAIALTAADGGFNATTEGLAGTIDTTGLKNGLHLVYVRAQDASGTWGPLTASFLRIKKK